MTLDKWLSKKEKFIGLIEEIEACKACSLYLLCQHQCPPYGDPNAQVMIIGEAPGRVENPDLRKLPFVGNRSSDLMMEICWDLWPKGFDELFITNVVKCNPPMNRQPGKDEIKACSIWLRKEIELVKPKVIIALGRTAANWFNIKESLNTAKFREYSWEGVYLYILPHPAYVLRFGEKGVLQYKGLFKLLKKRLEGIIWAESLSL